VNGEGNNAATRTATQRQQLRAPPPELPDWTFARVVVVLVPHFLVLPHSLLRSRPGVVAWELPDGTAPVQRRSSTSTHPPSFAA